MQSLTAVFTVGRDKKEGVEMQRLSQIWVKAFFYALFLRFVFNLTSSD